MTSKADLMGLGIAGPIADYEGFQPESVTAAGSSSAANATVLGPLQNFVNLVTAGGADSIRFNSSWPLGVPVIVANPTATTAQIYPPTGGNWNGGSTDATITLLQNKVRIFIRYSATLCYSFLTA